MTPIDKLLPLLPNVIARGDEWLSECPSCDKKRRTLVISEDANKTILLHCYRGCRAIDVVQAVGLKLSDLFEQKDERRMSARELAVHRRRTKLTRVEACLNTIGYEADVIDFAIKDIESGAPRDAMLARMRIAKSRIHEAVQEMK